MDESKRWLFSLIIIISMLFGAAGYMIFREWWAVGLGIMVGVILSIFSAYNYFMPVFHYYAYETHVQDRPNQNNDGRVILSLTIIANGSNRTIQLHGLEEEEWYQLGDGVVGRGYKYTLRDLQDIFNATNGNRIYGRITQKLGDESVCVLVPSGSNGWAVTEEIGKKFFDGLHERQLEVLEILPHSGD